MTREEKIEKAAAGFLWTLESSSEDASAAAETALRAALALPPSPAPSMQEIEALVDAAMNAAARLRGEPDTWKKMGAAKECADARAALLSAIRSALGHAEAEGWRAGAEAAREATARAFDFYSGPAPGSLGEFVRRVPLPAPEVRTQGNPKDKE